MLRPPLDCLAADAQTLRQREGVYVGTGSNKRKGSEELMKRREEGSFIEREKGRKYLIRWRAADAVTGRRKRYNKIVKGECSVRDLPR